MSELDDFIDQVLSPSSKAELVESVKDNIGLAEKCLIVFGFPDGRGGLQLKAYQVGFKYLYEIEGFSQWIAGTFISNSDNLIDSDN